MKIKNIDITFISVPPSLVSIPSAAFSILKSHLSKHGVQSKIIYLNHYLEKDLDFFSEDVITNTESLLPFLGMISKNDRVKSDYINTYYNCLFPDLFLTEKSYSEDILKDIEDKYYSIIDLAIEEIKENKSKIVGFSSKFHQWIPAIVIADKIKKALPDVLIMVGGWTNSKAALDFLSLNKNIDFCIWGEGEIPLQQIMENILQNIDHLPIHEIPRLIYRKNEEIIRNSGGTPSSYIDFDKINNVPDFTDYIDSINKLGLKNIILPVERGRGCNWNKCKFCYLAQGYKFRMKQTSTILREIESLIDSHNYLKFFFTDNDVVGEDLIEFNRFLDGLLLIKQKHNEFEIIMSEIITKGIDIDTIKKMSKAGFINVQVGLEAISESILHDINKKQNINENFFFIKNAIQNGINIKGANIIIETPNETDHMIMQSINNLHKYRFLLNHEKFSFNIIPLGVSNYSRYLKEIKDSKNDDTWNISEFHQIIPESYYKDIDRFSLMDYVVNTAEKPLWNLFHRALAFYKRKKFSYKTELDTFQKKIHYIESANSEIIKDIEIDDEIHWHTLHLLSNSVFQTDELVRKIQEIFIGLSKEEFLFKLDELKNEDIIFIDTLNDSVVSIINIDHSNP